MWLLTHVDYTFQVVYLSSCLHAGLSVSLCLHREVLSMRLCLNVGLLVGHRLRLCGHSISSSLNTVCQTEDLSELICCTLCAVNQKFTCRVCASAAFSKLCALA